MIGNGKGYKHMEPIKYKGYIISDFKYDYSKGRDLIRWEARKADDDTDKLFSDSFEGIIEQIDKQ